MVDVGLGNVRTYDTNNGPKIIQASFTGPVSLYLQAQTPLFLAAREGSYQVASLLLQHGAKQNLRNHMGHLPKDVALERLHHDILSLLDKPCLPPGTGQLSPHRPRPQPSSKLHRWPYPPKPSQLTPVPENEGPFKDATPSEEAMGQTAE